MLEIQEVDYYLLEGCGRCDLYQTPDCKVHNWPEELKSLRSIVLECGLKEEFKWSQPCYTYNGKNVLIVTAFKDYACISFFKGSLLSDGEGLLVIPGKSSQAARQLRFTDTVAILEQEDIIKAKIFEAIEVEKAGLRVEFKKTPEPLPEELLVKFVEMPELQEAFESLTPGRQRGYVLHFSQPKKSETRASRIERCVEKIMRGVGMHDDYRMKNR